MKLPKISERPFLFAYWGTDKRNDQNGVDSGDERHLILKELQNGMGRYHTRFIGRFSTVKRDMKPDRYEKYITNIKSITDIHYVLIGKITRQLQVDITRHWQVALYLWFMERL